MHAGPAQPDLCRRCVEILVFQLAHIAAVHGVGPLAAEGRNVEMVGTAANLLVGREGNPYPPVAHLGVVAQPDHGLHRLGDAGLVVGTQQRVAVSDDEVFAYVGKQFGKNLGRERHALAERDVTAVVVLHDAGLHVSAGAVGAGVVVGDEAYRGEVAGRVCGQRGVDVATVVEHHVVQFLALELLCQMARKDHLRGCAGGGRTRLRRLGVEGSVIKETFSDGHCFLSLSCQKATAAAAATLSESTLWAMGIRTT